MVNKFLERANVRMGIGLAAVLLASSTLIANILGLYREKLLLSYYYDTYPTAIDAYKVAFTIPDLRQSIPGNKLRQLLQNEDLTSIRFSILIPHGWKGIPIGKTDYFGVNTF